MALHQLKKKKKKMQLVIVIIFFFLAPEDISGRSNILKCTSTSESNESQKNRLLCKTEKNR